jgi:predicted metalloprotease
MRLDDERESDNVEDRRGESAGGSGLRGGSIGIGTVVIALVAWYFGIDPSFILNQGGGESAPAVSQAPAKAPPHADTQARFVSMILADTEDTWSAIFRAGGSTYEKPKLVLFTGAVRSACGLAESAMGPFYCPGDHKVYIDLAFYDELQKRFHAPGEFAQAYVIAHEVGHHVQNLMGISEKVAAAQRRTDKAGANRLSVKLELQADCFAGVWANQANRARQILEPGDMEKGLAAASAIGDDRLQKQARGYVSPESFTHGSSEQRVRWFRRGIDGGDFRQCDTFRARTL